MEVAHNNEEVEVAHENEEKMVVDSVPKPNVALVTGHGYSLYESHLGDLKKEGWLTDQMLGYYVVCLLDKARTD